jgi:hypothetical protein
LPGYLPADVAALVADAFSSRFSRDGQFGYFNPEKWGFGEPVYANRIIARAMAAPGVQSAAIGYFGRVTGPDVAPNAEGGRVIAMASREIVEVADDPVDPARGAVHVQVVGAA